MSRTRKIFQSENKQWRIVEILDEHMNIEMLKGDCFNPKVNTDIDPVKLAKQERAFENEVYNLGVYGYVLEKWNSEPDTGWEHIDSCWGFVGPFDNKNERYNHYIVEELKGLIK